MRLVLPEVNVQDPLASPQLRNRGTQADGHSGIPVDELTALQATQLEVIGSTSDQPRSLPFHFQYAART
jgi:hypothetical protein